jgi:hypothetical protein
MSIARIIAAAAAVSGASTVMAQEVPDPNPVFNPDGSQTWYVGFSTQYPVLQAVVNAASPGDEIVIRAGLYVESIVVDTPDLTIRPRVDVAGQWESVTLWNPTEGFNSDNDYAIKLGTNTNNTYIGRPRQYTQFATGATVEAVILPGEYNWEGVVGTEEAVASVTVATGGTGKVLDFWSRSQDDVAVWSDGGQGTFMSCSFKGKNGFGGAILCTAPTTGGTNTTSFVDCEINDLNASGIPLSGYPVNAITISGTGMNVYFSGCTIKDCTSGQYGAVYQNGGTSYWTGCNFRTNSCYAGSGTFNAVGANPMFSNCVFDSNQSRFATVYSNSSGMPLNAITSFYSCEFKDNLTENNQSGGVFMATDSGTSGGSPLVSFDACIVSKNNTAGTNQMTTYDIQTPYFPEMRIGQDFNAATTTTGPATIAGDVNEDGIVNGADIGILLGNWGLGG